jgi:hypothetical protein
MAATTQTAGTEAPLRELPPPLYAFLYAPQGLTTGFVTVTLGYLLTHNGVSVAAVGAVVSLHFLPQTWKFVASVLSSLANLPVLVVTVIVARVQPKQGSTGMLLVEAGIAVAALALYWAVASLWRPAKTPAPALAAAA